jgi:hypothetical protein
MARKRTGRRRGRPRGRNPNARRYQTTRAGRRGEVDRGSERLRARKRAATSREDLELTPTAVLFGRGFLDLLQYDKIGVVTALLRHVQKAMGRGSLSVTALWTALIDHSHSRITALPTQGDAGARRQLVRICRELDGCRSLVIELAEERTIPSIVLRAITHCLTPHDLMTLEALRQGLDAITVRSPEPD